MSVLRPLSMFLPDTANDLALIVLNRPLEPQLTTKLWRKSVLKAVTDGAIEELYRCFPENRDEFLPHFISGDFDSATAATLDYYKHKNVDIVPTPDQDETDFTKCLHIVCERIKSTQVSCIIALGGFGGRIDHSLASFNTLYTARTLTHLPVYIVTPSSVACLLDKGQHTIECDTGLEGDWCGLIPLGQPAEKVTTSGLKYNLNEQRLCFGELISTSNSIVSRTVTVQTDQPLVWSMGYKLS